MGLCRDETALLQREGNAGDLGGGVGLHYGEDSQLEEGDGIPGHLRHVGP